MFQGKEYIYEVYKERSFSKAANNLFISQPSLSAMVRKIENKIGTPIFDRSVNPIQLTECGKEYIKSVEKILDIEIAFESYLGSTNELKTGSLTIGGSNLFASFILPPLISAFTRQYPLVKVNLVEANTALLEEQLFKGMLDLVIDNYAFNENVYVKHTFCPDCLLLAVPKKFVTDGIPDDVRLTTEDIMKDKHRATSGQSVTLDRFQERPFLFLRPGNDTRKRAEKICENQGYHPHIILELDQQATAYNLVCYGMGITFVSDILIKKVKPDSNIVFFKLNDEEVKRNVYFYYKSGKYVTRAMEEFLRIAL